MSAYDKLSIVIPVGPDDLAWRNLLPDLSLFVNSAEIVLSACQSLPAEIMLPNNTIWLHGSQGRARQLNYGAKHAKGKVIWFLHCDTRLTDSVASSVNNFICNGAQGMGYFSLRFNHDGPWATRINAIAANLRSRLFGLPFGDQGFIISKNVFNQLQGFDEEVHPGEDLDFVIRLKAKGQSLHKLPGALITSARRYRHNGWVKTTIRHLWLTWKLTRQAGQRLRRV